MKERQREHKENSWLNGLGHTSPATDSILHAILQRRVIQYRTNLVLLAFTRDRTCVSAYNPVCALVVLFVLTMLCCLCASPPFSQSLSRGQLRAGARLIFLKSKCGGFFFAFSSFPFPAPPSFHRHTSFLPMCLPLLHITHSFRHMSHSPYPVLPWQFPVLFPV